MAAKTKWTAQQQAAIDARGCNILVSAAAGSGKTAVLTERAVCRMLDAVDPIDADRLLVVTFTRAAAAEMQQRMQKRLAEAIEQNPADKAARRQRRLLERAVIGTIDSLCLDIVQQNRHKLGLPAVFRMGDNREIDDIYADAIGEVLEQSYKNHDDRFAELVALFEKKQGDMGLEAAIAKLLGFAKSNPFYREWLQQKADIYDDELPAGQSVWGKILLEQVADEAAYYSERTTEALESIADDSGLSSYAVAFSADHEFFESLFNSAKRYDWDGCYDLTQKFSFANLGRAGKNADGQTKDHLQALRKEYKKTVEKLQQKIFFCDSNGFLSDSRYLAPRVKKLFELAVLSDRIMDEKKAAEGIFEFADVEQLAVQLLMQKTESGVAPTELARELQSRFDEIMVDEYQDVNAVQDMIVTALSNGKNLFMVGDVKQSIYRFRQARPEIFIERAERYAQPDNGEGRLIVLSGNFRSRKEIAQAANSIFRPLFSKKVGEIVYDETHQLEAMASYPDCDGVGAEFCVIERGDSLAADSAVIEAQYAAKKIKQLLNNNTLVAEKDGTLRPIRAGDIAILLRSTKSRAEIYKKALEEAGIEACAARENGFLGCYEVRAVIDLLRAVKNPTDEISLVGAMLSPMFDFTAERLAEMRAGNKKIAFFEAVRLSAEKDEQTERFLDIFDKLKRTAATADAVSVINQAIELTGFGLRCRAMKNGEQRFANLLMLINYAASFHNSGKRGLYGFLKTIDKIEEQGEDLAPAAVMQQNDAVAITSIHRSKGLEWPVVLLCDMGREFGYLSHDSRSPVALHWELGFACVRRDKARMIQLTTAQLEAVRMQSAMGQLSEELRILYVAVTRARERLIMIGSLKNAVDKAMALAPIGAGLADYQTAGCKCYADWVLSALGCCGSVDDALLRNGSLGGVALTLCEPQEEMADLTQTAQIGQPTDVGTEESAHLEIIERQINYRYPYEAAAKLPSKLSVSEITHRRNDKYLFAKKPSFAAGQGAGNERGTAVHAFMQFCDYAAAASDAAKELERMAQKGILSADKVELIDTAVIEKFFQSGLYAEIAAADEVKREFAFMTSAADCPSAKEQYSCGDEAVMLQGIADCVFIKNGCAAVLDYKTDRVRSAEELVERYKPQLDLYKEMLTKVLDMPVTRCVIWSFALGKSIEL